MGVPIARALRARLPRARIDVLLSRRNAVVGRAFGPYVNHVVRYTKRPLQTAALFARLRAARYRVVVDLIDIPSTTSRLLLKVTGARMRVGIGHERADVYTHAVPALDFEGMHIIERVAQLLRPFGIDPGAVPLDLEFPVAPEAAAAARAQLGPRPSAVRIGVNLSGSMPSKYWGRDNFVAFVRWLGATYPQAQVVVLGAPDYAGEVQAIVDRAPGARAAPTVRSFHEFAAQLHECDVIVTPDTSVSHLAAAWKRPSVVLFIETHHQSVLWRPWRAPHRALRHPVAIREIPVAQVMTAFQELMEETGVLRAGEPVCR